MFAASIYCIGSSSGPCTTINSSSGHLHVNVPFSIFQSLRPYRNWSQFWLNGLSWWVRSGAARGEKWSRRKKPGCIDSTNWQYEPDRAKMWLYKTYNPNTTYCKLNAASAEEKLGGLAPHLVLGITFLRLTMRYRAADDLWSFGGQRSKELGNFPLPKVVGMWQWKVELASELLRNFSELSSLFIDM